jgi:hypothetical protein
MHLTLLQITIYARAAIQRVLVRTIFSFCQGKEDMQDFIHLPFLKLPYKEEKQIMNL